MGRNIDCIKPFSAFLLLFFFSSLYWKLHQSCFWPLINALDRPMQKPSKPSFPLQHNQNTPFPSPSIRIENERYEQQEVKLFTSDNDLGTKPLKKNDLGTKNLS
eukprot:TRINITY_DN7338_c1_g1_i1.p1 TRINITY_DN7338_c1_g1~~TRINITY_DN7338_c1_g1_i1.p1  ORF type:complete len:104 (+),score=14.12 TRINITY_DN7338_c1_g1_i1:735-1046(+)